MDEFSCPVKRIKMSSPGDTTPVDITKTACRFGSSDFGQIVVTDCFVDKTLFIKTMFEFANKVLITAPRCSGKSIILDMVKRFLEIEVDDCGLPKTRMNYTVDSVTDTSNFKLFSDRHLIIMNYPQLVGERLGRHPVLRASFKCNGIVKCFGDALRFFRHVVRTAFLQHRYLLKSSVLDEQEKQFCKLWCDHGSYKCLDEEDVIDGLRVLSSFLHKHFKGRKVVVLVDDYDSPVVKAVSFVKDKEELFSVMQFCAGVISAVLKDNDTCVEYGLVTGLSYLVGAGSSDLDYLESCGFLEEHPFVEYYGLTVHEFETILHDPDFRLSEEMIQNARSRYVYRTKSGLKIYSLCSVLQFLQSKTVKNYLKEPSLICKLEELFHFSVIKKKAEVLLQDGTIAVDKANVMSLRDFSFLQCLILQVPPQGQAYDADLMFSLLLEAGYLSYTLENPISSTGTRIVSIPNEEVKLEFIEKLRRYYFSICKLNKQAIQDCISFFNNISALASPNDILFKENLNQFYEAIKEVFCGFANNFFIRLTEDTLHDLMFFITFQTNFKCMSQIPIQKAVLDLLLLREDLGIIIQLGYHSDRKSIKGTSVDALQQIVSKKYYSIFQDRRITRQAIRNHFLISLSVDNALNVSVSCLPNSYDVNKTIHLLPWTVAPV